ncbi:MAG: restriction endonuclease subunit S, partial [Vulcanimicrobiota bacterium]
MQKESWLLELEDIEKDTSIVIQELTVEERQPKSTKNRFRSGDVLYGKLRPYLNKIVIAEKSGYCTTEIIPVSTPSEIDNRFRMKSAEFRKYVDGVCHGVNMPRLGTKAGQDAPLL